MIEQFYLIPIDGTLTATTTPCLSEPESNDKEGKFHIPERSRLG